jgi:hypothetical protein
MPCQTALPLLKFASCCSQADQKPAEPSLQSLQVCWLYCYCFPAQSRQMGDFTRIFTTETRRLTPLVPSVLWPKGYWTRPRFLTRLVSCRCLQCGQFPLSSPFWWLRSTFPQRQVGARRFQFLPSNIVGPFSGPASAGVFQFNFGALIVRVTGVPLEAIYESQIFEVGLSCQFVRYVGR